MGEFAIQYLGESPIYPGHPITISLLIMHRFSDLGAAKQTAENGFSSALATPDIPGAGSEIAYALNLLERLAEGRFSLADAFETASIRWKENPLNVPADTIMAGQEQAKRLCDSFIAQAMEWLP